MKLCFNLDFKKAAFLAAYAATEKHGTFYDHSFFMVILCLEAQWKGTVIKLKKIGKHTVLFENSIAINAYACVVGKKEGEGRLREGFDFVSEDDYFSENTWEKAESGMLKKCFDICCHKADMQPSELNCILAGDLLNQCIGTTFALKDTNAPYLGLYGACSTMAESMAIGAMLLDGGYGENVCAVTGSHFSTAERQYRFPLEYGACKTPTAQNTVTGAGAVILSSEIGYPYLTSATVGKIVDTGLKDTCNMGAAMAPAAFMTLKAHFQETGRAPDYYDAVFTGDLGAVGHDILEALLEEEGLKLGTRYRDCGVMIYEGTQNKARIFGSGCGCCASVLCAHILPQIRAGVYKRVLFAATGALMSPTSSMQKQSIPSICHAVSIESGV